MSSLKFHFLRICDHYFLGRFSVSVLPINKHISAGTLNIERLRTFAFSITGEYVSGRNTAIKT